MKCPQCSHTVDKVIDSRPAEDGAAIRRRRECLACGARFTTYEKIEEVPIFVIKKDGMRESFDRTKILQGLVKACEKRPVSMERIEAMVRRVERQITQSMTQEVKASTIGELLMNELKSVDEVAYVRFASVYRQFTDVRTFMQEIEKLVKASSSPLEVENLPSPLVQMEANLSFVEKTSNDASVQDGKQEFALTSKMEELDKADMDRRKKTRRRAP